MRSDQIGVGPKPSDGCSCKKTCEDLGHRHREKPCAMEADAAKAKGASCHQKPGEA